VPRLHYYHLFPPKHFNLSHLVVLPRYSPLRIQTPCLALWAIMGYPGPLLRVSAPLRQHPHLVHIVATPQSALASRVGASKPRDKISSITNKAAIWCTPRIPHSPPPTCKRWLPMTVSLLQSTTPKDPTVTNSHPMTMDPGTRHLVAQDYLMLVRHRRGIRLGHHCLHSTLRQPLISIAATPRRPEEPIHPRDIPALEDNRIPEVNGYM
jgi:hypothetical protein